MPRERRMNQERTRESEVGVRTHGEPPGAAGGGQLADLRAAAERVSSQSRDAVDQALSQDPESFLQSARQQSAE